MSRILVTCSDWAGKGGKGGGGYNYRRDVAFYPLKLGSRES